MNTNPNLTKEGSAPPKALNDIGEVHMDQTPISSAESVKRRRSRRRVPLTQHPIDAASKVYSSPTPRFLLISREEGDFKQVSPFMLSRELAIIAGGPVKQTKKTANGLLVEVRDISQTPRLLASKRLGQFEIKVAPHATLK